MRIADLHCDTVLRVEKGADLATKGGGHIDIPRLREGDVGLQAFAAFIATDTPSDQGFARATFLLDAIVGQCEKHSDDLTLVTSAREAQHATEGGRVGALLTVENGAAIDESIEKLEALRSRGVRSMTLVHQKNLSWVGSCSEPDGGLDGLSSFGERVVDAMCGMGMIVDVSHASETAFWKVAPRVRRTGKPFIASHSNSWELCRSPRNLKDDQIREIADQGGVIGMNFFPLFLDAAYYEAFVAKEKQGVAPEAIAGEMGACRVTSQSIYAHIDRIVGLVGDDHVSFGSDFDGIFVTPDDVTGCDAFPSLLDGLRARGYTETSIEKIAWGNFMRVLSAHDSR